MGHRLRQNQKEALSNQGFFFCAAKKLLALHQLLQGAANGAGMLL